MFFTGIRARLYLVSENEVGSSPKECALDEKGCALKKLTSKAI